MATDLLYRRSSKYTLFYWVRQAIGFDVLKSQAATSFQTTLGFVF